MLNKSLLYQVPLTLAAAYGVYSVLKMMIEPQVSDHDLNGRLHPRVASHLPIAKRLPTIPDAGGNYDMDGVSFDSDGVVVASDYAAI